jgi:hypothetical protein
VFTVLADELGGALSIPPPRGRHLTCSGGVYRRGMMNQGGVMFSFSVARDREPAR